MPRKSRKPSDNLVSDHSNLPEFFSPSDAPWGGFINVRLTDEHRGQFEAWYSSHSNDIGAMLTDILATGIKLSLTFDHENQCFLATLTGALVPPSRDRFAVSTRAGTMSEVLALACWKHFVLAKQNYGAFRPKSGDFLHWG